MSFHLATGFKIHREGDKTQRQCLNRINVLSSAGACNVGTVKRRPHLPGILKLKTLGCNARVAGETASERKHQLTPLQLLLYCLFQSNQSLKRQLSASVPNSLLANGSAISEQRNFRH